MKLIIKLFFAILFLGCSGSGAIQPGVHEDSRLVPADAGVALGDEGDASFVDDAGALNLVDVATGSGTDVEEEAGDTASIGPDALMEDTLEPGADADVSEPLEDALNPDHDDTEPGDDSTGIVVVGDASSGPIFGTPDSANDTGASEGDDTGEGSDVQLGDDDAGPVEGDTTEEPIEPGGSCVPNPCEQGAASTCLDGVVVAYFTPGDCTLTAGGATSCEYIEQSLDCAAAGGSCVGGVCEDAPPSPGEGELVITEVMRAPYPNKRQWFELYVAADSPRNLAGCGLMDGASKRVVFGASPLIVEPGQFVLVAEVEPVSDGLPSPDVTFPIGVLNLASSDGPLVVNCMGTVVDIVDLSSGTALNPFPAEAGVAMQVSPGNYAAELNDTTDAWCSAEDPYAFGAFGSPGAANPSCNADIDRCRLWYPAFGSGSPGDVIEALAIVFDEGLTDESLYAPDPSPGFIGEIGLGPDGTNPEVQPGAFSWFSASPEYDPPSTVPPQDDMYGAWVIPSASGVFDLAARFSPDNGQTWVYCDLDGSDNGYQLNKAGHVLVQ